MEEAPSFMTEGAGPSQVAAIVEESGLRSQTATTPVTFETPDTREYEQGVESFPESTDCDEEKELKTEMDLVWAMYPLIAAAKAAEMGERILRVSACLEEDMPLREKRRIIQTVAHAQARRYMEKRATRSKGTATLSAVSESRFAQARDTIEILEKHREVVESESTSQAGEVPCQGLGVYNKDRSLVSPLRSSPQPKYLESMIEIEGASNEF
jgi:hypothetical protein